LKTGFRSVAHNLHYKISKVIQMIKVPALIYLLSNMSNAYCLESPSPLPVTRRLDICIWCLLSGEIYWRCG